MNDEQNVYRILDANFNRLREALRVVEEYFRFVRDDESASVQLKKMRHSLTEMERKIDVHALLSSRDTDTDCFAFETRAEEMSRDEVGDVLNANFKRAQEACRVIEEYAKVTPQNAREISAAAKGIRFALYKIQSTCALS